MDTAAALLVRSGWVGRGDVDDTQATDSAQATVHYLPTVEACESLPRRLTSFVGREDEVVALSRAIQENRLVTVSGPGGVGKSRLAVESARQVAPTAVWVELSPVTGQGMVALMVAAALGLRQEPGRSIAVTLAEQLARRETLLVLDNVDHLLLETAELIDGLMPAAPRLTVVVTSREPLGVSGEVTWRVPPLTQAAAVALFVARTRLVRPSFDPDGSDLAVVSDLCVRLDRLPLAIELAAARLRVLSPIQLATSLDQRLLPLPASARNVPAQQRTLEASLAWSHDLLDEPERVLLRRLSVFSGAFSTEGAAAVGTDLADVDEVLFHLVDKSLVQVENTEPPRLRLLQTVRLFAHGRLVEAGEGDLARSAHAAHFLVVAERTATELVRADAPRWLDELDADFHELETALGWYHSQEVPDLFRRIVVALGLFWELRHGAVGVRWLRHAVHQDGDGSVLWAQVLWQSAHMGVYGDDLATTARRAPQAVLAAQAAGDARTLARALTTANYCTAVSDPPRAKIALAESVRLCREAGDLWATGDALKMASIACLTSGENQGLFSAERELRAVADELGNAFFLAWCHAIKGYVCLQRGDVDDARTRLEASAALCRRIGDPMTAWLTTAWLGDLEALTGRVAQARTAYTETLARASASGGTVSRVWALVGAARLLREAGGPARASALLEPAREQFLAADPVWRSLYFTEYGKAQLATSPGPDAEASLRIGLDAAQKIGNPLLSADALQGLACAAVEAGDVAGAEALHHQALALRVASGLVPGILESLEDLACLPAPEPEPAAVRLIAACAAVRDQRSLPRRSLAELACRDVLEKAGQHFGAEGVRADERAGAALSLEEAVAYASRSRGKRSRPRHGWASLTPTELEVVHLVAEGLNNPEVGARMFIGRGTVKTHLAHVYAKLGVSSRAGLAAEVIRQGH